MYLLIYFIDNLCRYEWVSEFDPVSEQCTVYQYSGLLYLPVSGRMGGEILSHRYCHFIIKWQIDGLQRNIFVWNLNLKVWFITVVKDHVIMITKQSWYYTIMYMNEPFFSRHQWVFGKQSLPEWCYLWEYPWLIHL